MSGPDGDLGSLPAWLFRRALAEAASPVSFADARAPDLPLVYVNAAFERVTGFAASEVLGRNCRVVQGPHRDETELSVVRRALAAHRPVAVRLLNQRPDGSDWWNELHLSFVRDDRGTVTHVLGVQHDVTEQVLAQQGLQELAYQDPLTGLPNRRQLDQHLALALARAERAGSAVAVLALDLDGFKTVNDSHGHVVGDALLREVAARLRGAVRSTDLVARMGGDEFVVLLADLPRDGASLAVAAVVAQIRDGLRAAFRVDGVSLRLAASIGQAVDPPSGGTRQDLLRLADEDMYRDKASRRD